ncbi:MAG: GEVED domain-containing protein [Bacteroidaceae bacterium]
MKNTSKFVLLALMTLCTNNLQAIVNEVDNLTLERDVGRETSLHKNSIKEDYYTFTSYNGNESMYEDNGGNLVYGSYDQSTKCFWEIIPTDKAHCYYVRNAISGNYIQSTVVAGNNKEVKMGSTPIEYCIAENTAVEANYYYFVSTDNSNYATPSATNLGLNKGATSILAYAAGTSNKNSYWKLTKTKLLYDFKPFASSDTLGAHAYNYLIVNKEGQCVEVTANGLDLKAKNSTDAQQWYFVGVSNEKGYKIASNLYPKKTLNIVAGDLKLTESTEATLWQVAVQSNASTFCFHPLTTKEDLNTCLTIGNDSLFSFLGVRNAFSRNAQIYELPCGILGTRYISKASIVGETVLKTLTYATTTLPSGWYTLFVDDKATVSRGTSFKLSLSLNLPPVEGSTLLVYFDWNRDGLFETQYSLTAMKDIDQTISVPANAILGKTRMRVRLTSNGLLDAEDDVKGQTIDFILNTSEPQLSRTVTLDVNSDDRGTASLSNVAKTYPYGTQLTAIATPKGNSQFISWCEGKKVLSTDANYTFIVDHNIPLVAYFSPNLEGEDLLGIEAPVATKSFVYELVNNGINLEVITAENVISVRLYTPDGKLIRQTSTKKIPLSGITKGSYVIKVCTEKMNCGNQVIIK